MAFMSFLRGKGISIFLGLCFGLGMGWYRAAESGRTEKTELGAALSGVRERAPATVGGSAGVQPARLAAAAPGGEPVAASGVGASLPPNVREVLRHLELLALYQKYRAYFPAGEAGDAAATVTVLREEMTRGLKDPVGIAARSELERLKAKPELAFQAVQEGLARMPHGKDLGEENQTRHFWLQLATHLGADQGKVSEWLEGQTRERAVTGDVRSPSVAFEALLQMHAGDRGRIDTIFEEALRSQERSEEAQRALIFAYARVDVAKAEQLDRQLASGSRRRRR